MYKPHQQQMYIMYDLMSNGARMDNIRGNDSTLKRREQFISSKNGSFSAIASGCVSRTDGFTGIFLLRPRGWARITGVREPKDKRTLAAIESVRCKFAKSVRRSSGSFVAHCAKLTWPIAWTPSANVLRQDRRTKRAKLCSSCLAESRNFSPLVTTRVGHRT